jgi:hypothetical protein
MAFVLGISIVLSIDNRMLRNHKKPSTTSTSAKTARVSFGEDKYTKDLWILCFFDAYNHEIEHMDRADQLFAYNPGLRPCCYGG